MISLIRHSVAVLALLGLFICCSNADQPPDPQIDITNPIILLSEDSIIQTQTITISLEENAYLEGARILPEAINWSIKGEHENQIIFSKTNINQFRWKPDISGLFNVAVLVYYSPNDSISSAETVFVFEDFRMAYIGDYHFVKNFQWQGTRDTVEYDGYIDLVEGTKNRVIIKCGEDEWESFDFFATELEFANESIHPYFVVEPMGRNYFAGEFLSFDTVKLYGYTNPLGGTYSWEIIGLKTH